MCQGKGFAGIHNFLAKSGPAMSEFPVHVHLFPALSCKVPLSAHFALSNFSSLCLPPRPALHPHPCSPIHPSSHPSIQPPIAPLPQAVLLQMGLLSCLAFGLPVLFLFSSFLPGLPFNFTNPLQVYYLKRTPCSIIMCQTNPPDSTHSAICGTVFRNSSKEAWNSTWPARNQVADLV